MNGQMLTFRLGDHLMGVDVGQVQEVLRAQPVTPVPGAPEAVAGLINLRGQVVTALDLRVIAGLPGRADLSAAMNVVVHDGMDPASLLVDQVADVVAVTDADFEPPPPTLTGPARALVRGAYKLPTGLLLALDLSAAVSP